MDTLMDIYPFLGLSPRSRETKTCSFLLFCQLCIASSSYERRYQEISTSYSKELCNPNCVDKNLVLSWISFASQNNVEDLIVDVALEKDAELTVSHLFTCTNLRYLQLWLGFSLLKLPISPSLPNLQILKLFHIKLDDNARLSQMISSFPSLHTLKIKECEFQNEPLTIVNSHVVKLFFGGKLPYIKISAPGLISLTIVLSGLWYIDDCPSLICARIDIRKTSYESMKQLATALTTAESLVLRGNFIQACSNAVTGKQVIHEWIETPFTNLKFLRLETSFTNHEVQAIKAMLSFSPNIITFGVRRVATKVSTNYWGGEATEMLEYEYNLSRLELVHVEEFVGSQNEQQLVNFFIEKAPNLKKLSLRCEDGVVKKEELDWISKLRLKCPQISEICLEDHPLRCCVLFQGISTTNVRGGRSVTGKRNDSHHSQGRGGSAVRRGAMGGSVASLPGHGRGRRNN